MEGDEADQLLILTLRQVDPLGQDLGSFPAVYDRIFQMKACLFVCA